MKPKPSVKGNFEGQMGSRMKKVRAILKKAKVRMPALIYLKDRSRADIMEMDKILRADITWIDLHPKTATKPGKECARPLP